MHQERKHSHKLLSMCIKCKYVCYVVNPYCKFWCCLSNNRIRSGKKDKVKKCKKNPIWFTANLEHRISQTTFAKITEFFICHRVCVNLVRYLASTDSLAHYSNRNIMIPTNLPKLIHNFIFIKHTHIVWMHQLAWHCWMQK